MANFTVAFKSTIDKLGYDLGQSLSPTLDLIDLDDLVVSAELFKTRKDALVWEFLTMDELPRDPMYSFTFRIGARTVKDIANYNILKMIDSVKAIFPTESNLDISDYSGSVAGPKLGYMFITSVGVDPQMFDKDSGIRMILVSGRCVRSG